MKRICLLLSAVVWISACSGGGADGAADGNAARSGAIALPSGELTELTVIDVVVGDGPAVQNGDTAIVHYTGWLYDPAAGNRRGAQFDSSRGGEPFTFQPGARRVIRGWEEGVPGMRVGGRRLLFIPAEYGYGERGTPDGTIPPNAGLVFDVELVNVIPLP